MVTKKDTNKICIVTSGGGHLFQVYRLKLWWSKRRRFWVTLRGEDTQSMLVGESVYWAYGPDSRNAWNAIRNFLFAWNVLLREKPTLLVSCGAGVAPPFFYVGKLLGIRLVFIEPFDFISYPTLSGRLISPIADEVLVQHKEQLRFYPKAKYKGSVL